MRHGRLLPEGPFVLAALLVGCAGPPGPALPRLTVVLSVDQLRADYLERFEEHYTGGFRRLLEEGAYFHAAAYRHSSTSTGPGHATISTGRHPAAHGIVGNSWREPGVGRVYCVDDDRHEPVGGPGTGASPQALLTETLGDLLKRAHPGAKVYSVSTKDRSAILMGGRRADGAFWFEPDCACVVSSTYYGDRLPGWLERFNASGPGAAHAGRSWDRLLGDPAVYERLARADDFPGEGDGRGATFPHRLPDDGFGSLLARTPYSDEVTIGAALAALESGEIGTDDVPDLLFVGLSATDSIGHRYGPFSQEAMDNHLRLDRRLGEFLEEVDRVVGPGRSAIALTADHGAMPLVEHLRANGDSSARRISTSDFWQRATPAIEECGQGPASEVVDATAGGSLHWNVAALGERGVSREKASTCVQGWLSGQPEVADVFTAEGLSGPVDSELAALFRNAYREGRSPHLQVHFAEGAYPGGPNGTGHGSAHIYDRRVPVVLAGVGIVPGRHDSAAGPEDVAPTLGVLLGLEPQLESDTRVLSEALGSDR